MAEKKQAINKLSTDPAGTQATLSSETGISDQVSDSGGTVDPIMLIADELAKVAHGKGVPDLRRMVDHLFPREREAADAFMKKLNLLKLGAEAVVQTAQELYGGLDNR